MNIKFYEEKKIFKLDTENSTYILQVSEFNHLLHRYYGAFISDFDVSKEVPIYIHASNSAYPAESEDQLYSLDTLMQEYSTYNTGDMGLSAISIKNAEGYISSSVKYVSHKISKGKVSLEAMPSSYANSDDAITLEIVLEDSYNKVNVSLFYSVFSNNDVITRHVKIHNCSENEVSLLKAASATVDFADKDFDLISLYGTWAKERNIDRNNLPQGVHKISSKRGSSSHVLNPFIILANKKTDEFSGEAYGVNLIYSTNYSIETEKSFFGSVRVVAGINDEGFEWVLNPGETFETPEVALAYSASGLNKLSQAYHSFFRDNVTRGEWQYKKRPLLINSWEAAYFDFTDDTLFDFAKSAKELGIEMLVMDDGWFGERNDDKTSLGDWFVNEDKLKGGLKKLVDRVNEIGMEFGIWFEPEMISPVSKLYEEHPDWCIHIPGRSKSLGRNQLVLDMSRADVCDYLFNAISDILSSCNIIYVKWDFNRNITEAASILLDNTRQGEFFHRYVLGLYSLLDRLNKAFPKVLFEGCSGGGGRFDGGMLAYSPQIWTSDDTDPILRLQIQYGTSMAYPVSAMGAHVSESPNHQTGRETPLDIRGKVALCGTFGYELNPLKLSDEEKETVKKQVEDYHKYYDTIQSGDFYRLINPFEDYTRCAWQFISKDKNEVIIFYYISQVTSPQTISIVKPVGLEPGAVYVEEKTQKEYHGDTLMNMGIYMRDIRKLYDCEMLVLRKK